LWRWRWRETFERGGGAGGGAGVVVVEWIGPLLIVSCEEERMRKRG